MVTSEELPGKNTLCQPAARQAHKQDHLAIISSQAQIYAAKQTFIRKNGRRGKNRTGGGRFGREERVGMVGVGGRRVGYWSQGGVSMSQWGEIVENIRNFHRGIPCN